MIAPDRLPTGPAACTLCGHALRQTGTCRRCYHRAYQATRRALERVPRCAHPDRGWRRFPLSARPGGVPVCCATCGRWGVVYPRRKEERR